MDESQATVIRDELPVVSGDAGQLSHLFQNLIGNSLKYRKQGTPPQIHISARRNDNEWIITVRDNGIGFDPAKSEAIFAMFQRLRGNEFAGSGIGLAICKRITERHGGRIQATAAPGEGASFSFSIPDIHEVQTPVPESRPAAQAGQSASSGPPLAGRLSETGLRGTLSLAPVVVREMDGTILIWTRGQEHLFGWSEHQAVGRRVHDLLKTVFPKPLAAIEAELLETGEWSGELQAVKRDGRKVRLATHWALYRDGKGEAQSVTEVHAEINTRKEPATELSRSVPA
jgi:PAS domain S-box-containing protein